MLLGNVCLGVDPDAARAAYSRAIELEPDSALALVARVNASLRLGSLEGVQRDLERALELAPELPEAWLARGLVRARAGDRAGARQDLTRFLELAPPDHAERARARARLAELR